MLIDVHRDCLSISSSGGMFVLCALSCSLLTNQPSSSQLCLPTIIIDSPGLWQAQSITFHGSSDFDFAIPMFSFGSGSVSFTSTPWTTYKCRWPNNNLAHLLLSAGSELSIWRIENIDKVFFVSWKMDCCWDTCCVLRALWPGWLRLKDSAWTEPTQRGGGGGKAYTGAHQWPGVAPT